MARVLEALLFVGAGLTCLGVALALIYEALALLTRLVPTISNITVGEVLTHRTGAFIAFFLAGVVVGALAAHFGDWIP